MAADLARTPSSGIRVQLCGDAHLSNFGVFGSPERTLVFDMNDFDETAPGPWEWDVKRLAASFAIGGRENGFSRKERRTVVLDTVRSYREAMTAFAQMGNLDVWYAHLSVDQAIAEFTAGVGPKRLKKAEATIEKSRTKDSMQALEKLTTLVDGERRIISDPPLIVPIDELAPSEMDRDAIVDEMRKLIRSYRRSLETDRRHLLGAVQVRRPGPQGGRGRQRRHPRLDRAVPRHRRSRPAVPPGQGGAALRPRAIRRQEPVQQQRPAGDRRPTPDASHQRHLPRLGPRQLGSRRAGTRLLRPPAQGLERLVRLRGSRPRRRGRLRESVRLDLARAHARSGDRVAIASYLGASDSFDQAIAAFAETYAEQNERDYRALQDAVDEGRVTAQTGL